MEFTSHYVDTNWSALIKSSQAERLWVDFPVIQTGLRGPSNQINEVKSYFCLFSSGRTEMESAPQSAWDWSWPLGSHVTPCSESPAASQGQARLAWMKYLFMGTCCQSWNVLEALGRALPLRTFSLEELYGCLCIVCGKNSPENVFNLPYYQKENELQCCSKITAG